jgi:hypothetical protein
MYWKSIPLESIVTRNVIYFDEEKKDVCEKICKVLKIDCFPDIFEKRYWQLHNGEWESKEINYSVTLNSENDVFNSNLKDLFEKNDSNIIFVSNDCHINGVIHFTNYENRDVFSILYQNIHVFERNLRFLLDALNHNYKSFLKYYEYKRKSSTGKSIEHYAEKIKNMSSLKFQNESKRWKPLEILDFKELIEYSISSFHSEEELGKIGLKDNQTKIISATLGTLRNTIMHSKTVSGETVSVPYNFVKFKNFFNGIQEFKKIFNLLSQRICTYRLENVKQQNMAILGMLDKMNEQAIKNYFYSNF